MPYIQQHEPHTDAGSIWHTFFTNAFARRIPASQLERPLQELRSSYDEPPQATARALLSFRVLYGRADDPLLFAYARLLLQQNFIRAEHLLLALLESSHLIKDFEVLGSTQSGLPSCEERMFNMLTQMCSTKEGLIFEAHEAHGLVHALTRWMHTITSYEMSKQLDKGALHSLDGLSFGMYDAAAALVITTLGSPVMRQVGTQGWWKKRKATIVNEMENFDTHVLLWMHSQLAGRLRALATVPPYLPTDDEGRPKFTNQQVLQSIHELPVENTRAGLYVWLHACLCARPLTDDLSMLAYFQARYAGNNQTIAVDLIVASFDVLTSMLLAKETEPAIKSIRSFICNKVPPFLSLLSSFLALTGPIEACIQLAFMSITMDALPPITQGSSELRERLKVTRLEFLQACALHSLVSENTISLVLQEPPVSLPRVLKYSKEGLTAQCVNNIGRLEQYIEDLDGMQGNAGAIAGCIVDTVSNLCNNKDTMSLTSLCNMLTRRIRAMDIVLQYTTASGLLLPLCSQLDAWSHDQDQSEFTPEYEEFASILLFILATVHRYGLKRADLGLVSDEGFVATFLQTFASSIPSENLTPEQSGRLAKWIEGLYATDEFDESSGISDDVMRHCPPQAFYRIVPTLFEQSVLACACGALPLKTFTGGLELLVEPFLLPSLIGGLSWLAKHARVHDEHCEILLQMLDRLLKPSSSSQETKTMHRAIMVIVAKPLYSALEQLSERRQDKSKQIGALLDIIRHYHNQQRTMEVDPKDLAEWTFMPSGGIAEQLRKCIHDLVTWVCNIGPSPPPSYSHKLFTTACELLGPKRVLDALITEIRTQTGIGNGASALDIVTTMICALADSPQGPLVGMNAPTHQTQNPSLHVRDVLRFRVSDVQALLKLQSSEAEALVQLHRKVEAQLVAQQTPHVAMPSLQDHSTDQMMAELGLDTEVAVNAVRRTSNQAGQLDTATVADFANVDLTSALAESMMDHSAGQGIPPDTSRDIFDDLGLGLGQQAQNLGGQTELADQANAEEDIFAGLNMDLGGGDFDF